LSPSPAEEWFTVLAEGVQRTDKAIARARDQAVFAENLLSHLYLIRDRLALIERETSDLAARSRTR
jgi:hypothetical protein